MSSLNTAIKRPITHEGGIAKNITPKEQLERSVMSCLLWEDNFYEDGLSISDRISNLVGLNKIQDVVEIARRAKFDMKLRHVPLLVACEAASKFRSSSLERKTIGHLIVDVIQRADDLTEFLAIYWRNGKKPIGKQIKLALSKALRKFDEYQLQKYNRDKAIKLRDVLCMVRPKPINDEQAALWKKLLENNLETPNTWETRLSSGEDKKAVFTDLVTRGRLGGLAFLRNIRNMVQSNVEDSVIRKGLITLKVDKLLPINFIAAGYASPQYEPLIEEKFLESFNEGKINKRVIVLVDVSGSMENCISNKSEMTRIDYACSIAAIARETFTDARIYTFSSRIIEIPARRGFGLIDAIKISQPHLDTRLGDALEYINEVPYDILVVISDEQTKDKVPNPIGKAYMINVSTNKNGVGYRGTWHHIDGFSNSVINYIVKENEDNINQS